MTKYKKVKLNRVYKGYASMRDYVWKECVDAGKGIEFECKGAKFTLEPWEVKNGRPGPDKYISKYDGRTYSLVDFLWRSTNSEREQRLI